MRPKMTTNNSNLSKPCSKVKTSLTLLATPKDSSLIEVNRRPYPNLSRCKMLINSKDKVKGLGWHPLVRSPTGIKSLQPVRNPCCSKKTKITAKDSKHSTSVWSQEALAEETIFKKQTHPISSYKICKMPMGPTNTSTPPNPLTASKTIMCKRNSLAKH